MIFNRENMVDMLQNNIVTITFTKVDGSERVMKATLLPEYVPAPQEGKVLLQESSASDPNVRVWDVEANGWRSFRVASVKSISVG